MQNLQKFHPMNSLGIHGTFRDVQTTTGTHIGPCVE